MSFIISRLRFIGSSVQCSLHTPEGNFKGVEGTAQLCDYATAFADFRSTVEGMIAEGKKQLE
jgi:hypothetical protein